MSENISYVLKTKRTGNTPKVAGIFGSSKKSGESKPGSAGIPNAFLRKVQFMEKYPQSLRDYIKKCFAQCVNDQARDIVSAKLIETINEVSANGMINQHNWISQPLVTAVEKEPTPPPPPPPEKNPSFPSAGTSHAPGQAFSSSFMSQHNQPPPPPPPPPSQQQQIQQQGPPNYGYPYYPPPPPPPHSQHQQQQHQQQQQQGYGYQSSSYGYPPYQNQYPPSEHAQPLPLQPPPPPPRQPQQQQPFHDDQQQEGYIPPPPPPQNYSQYQQNQYNSYAQPPYQYQQPQQYEYQQPQPSNYNNNNFNSNYNNNQQNNNKFNYNNMNNEDNENNNNSYNNNNFNNRQSNTASFAPGQNIPKTTLKPPPISATWSNSSNYQKQSSNQNQNQSQLQTPPKSPKSPKSFEMKSPKQIQKENQKNKKNKNKGKQNSFFSNTQQNDKNSNLSHIQRIQMQMNEGETSMDDLTSKRIVGTSTKLEKEYLRLAGDELDPSMFRPLHILKESFEYCLKKFNDNNDYEYISEQLRSIRQDLKVQHIEDQFSVAVYETHARLAIQNDDWGNFNQSMEPLELFYKKGLGEFDHTCEFYCYRILYLVGVDDLAGLYAFIPRIEAPVLESKDVQFALKVWKIASSGEWMRFFRKMRKAPPLVAGVMSIKARSFRFQALRCTIKGFRPPTMETYRTFLCFDDDEATRNFLVDEEITIPEK